MWRWLLIILALGTSCAGRQTPEGLQEVVVGPIPVPQPVYPREALSNELQELWTRVEEAVAVRPPEPPDGASQEIIESWAEGAFRNWLLQRQAATDRALAATHALSTHPLFERGIGTALFGYMYEDMAGSIRGAPVPTNIAADAELLEIYTNALNEHIMPFAQLSARAYYACVALFIKLDDPQWGEWAYYCDERGSEVVDTFELKAPEPPDVSTTVTQLVSPR
ncbi:MAG: hypothetical protein WCF10_12790 [Polyangiales bacterium]